MSRSGLVKMSCGTWGQRKGMFRMGLLNKGISGFGADTKGAGASRQALLAFGSTQHARSSSDVKSPCGDARPYRACPGGAVILHYTPKADSLAPAELVS